jgi:hypothetical protein
VAAVVRGFGARAARMVKLDGVSSPPLPLPFPFFVREDRRDGGPMVLVPDERAWQQVVSTLPSFQHPVAVEYIDVQRRGLHPKWRCVVLGERSFPAHFFALPDWVVRFRDETVSTPELREEELRYVTAPDPHHELFVHATRALDLDFAAWDYSYTPAGELVVWEANTQPGSLRWTPVARDRFFQGTVDFLLGNLTASSHPL